MSDFPSSVAISEEGPREGFQIEPGSIPTEHKIKLINALSDTGVKSLQIASFVNAKRVPGMADAEAVVTGFTPRASVSYSAMWLNEAGFLRANAFTGRLKLKPTILMSASEAFLVRNQKTNLVENVAAQQRQINLYRQYGLPIEHGMVMAAFGCNFEGDIEPAKVLGQIEVILSLAAQNDLVLKQVSLADTMGWAVPLRVKKLADAVRSRWPDLPVALHLHDTRGVGLANAYAGLMLGIDRFDAAVAGLGGCPFAGHRGAAGNICTEDFAFMCEEMGISTGLDLGALVDAARLAEEIVGHPLPGRLMHGGTLGALRQQARLAADA